MKKHDIHKMRRLYEEWESSGQSMKAFSLENNVTPATFSYWAKSIRKERRQVQTAGFVRLPMPKETLDGSRVAAITFPSGARLDLYHPFSVSFIKELVG